MGPNRLYASPMSDHATATINGAEIHITTEGPTDAPAVLLIHAGVADSRMFDPNAAALAERFRVVRYDMRGFGRSSLPPGEFSNHEDALGVLDHSGVKKAHLLGVSFGGVIAIELALANPERVGRLVLGAANVRGIDPSERVRAFWEEEEALLDDGKLAEATELNLRLWVDGPHRQPGEVDPAVREAVRVMQMAAFEVPEPEGPEVDEIEPDPPASTRLADLTMPTLVLCGDLDLPDKLELSERLGRELPDARFEVIQAAAHMLNMERPDEFNRAVLAFLDHC